MLYSLILVWRRCHAVLSLGIERIWYVSALHPLISQCVLERMTLSTTSKALSIVAPYLQDFNSIKFPVEALQDAGLVKLLFLFSRL